MDRKIHVFPEELEPESRVVAISDGDDALPEHLALPLAWRRYHPLSVTLTTTVDKLLSVTSTEIERTLALSGGAGEPEDLRIPTALWCRTVIHVASRLGAAPEPAGLAALRSRLWTVKAFVDERGEGWTIRSFSRALAIARGELW